MVSGIRFGECLGLTWDNLDVETNTVRIEKGFDSLHTRDFTDGKTKNAKRTIIIPSEVMKLLFQLPKDTERVFHDITNNGVKKLSIIH